jgi:DNA-binding IclR family transcriptional regulator
VRERFEHVAPPSTARKAETNEIAGRRRSSIVVLTRIESALRALKNCFLEAPACRLAAEEACAITGLDQPTCDALLRALQDVRFLWRDNRGDFRLCAGVAASADGDMN